MKFIYTFLSLGFLILGITSCNSAAKFKAELEEIDSCVVILDSIEIKYNGIEFDSLRIMVEHILNNEEMISQLHFYQIRSNK